MSPSGAISEQETERAIDFWGGQFKSMNLQSVDKMPVYPKEGAVLAMSLQVKDGSELTPDNPTQPLDVKLLVPSWTKLEGGAVKIILDSDGWVLSLIVEMVPRWEISNTQTPRIECAASTASIINTLNVGLLGLHEFAEDLSGATEGGIKIIKNAMLDILHEAQKSSPSKESLVAEVALRYALPKLINFIAVCPGDLMELVYEKMKQINTELAGECNDQNQSALDAGQASSESLLQQLEAAYHLQDAASPQFIQVLLSTLLPQEHPVGQVLIAALVAKGTIHFDKESVIISRVCCGQYKQNDLFERCLAPLLVPLRPEIALPPQDLIAQARFFSMSPSGGLTLAKIFEAIVDFACFVNRQAPKSKEFGRRASELMDFAVDIAPQDRKWDVRNVVEDVIEGFKPGGKLRLSTAADAAPTGTTDVDSDSDSDVDSSAAAPTQAEKLREKAAKKAVKHAAQKAAKKAAKGKK